MKNYIWYACYGSNLLSKRFLLYINGGKANFYGIEIENLGSRENIDPIKTITTLIPYELIFAKQSRNWKNKGVAFVKLTEDKSKPTYVKLYLISLTQFEDLIKQENGRNKNYELHLDLNSLEAINENLKVFSWYNHILYLGEKEGYPIFTLTGTSAANSISEPSLEYLKVIIDGLRESINLENNKIKDYLKSKINFNEFDSIEFENIFK